MEFTELIKVRESIRNYDPGHPVSKDVLLKILDAGRLAPSAANRQPWKFVIIASNEMLARIKVCYERDWFRDAPQILAVVGDESEAWTRRYDQRCFIETDLAIAMYQLILAATNEGVGTCWISNFKPDIAGAALGLKDRQYVLAMTPLGYPRSDYKRKEVKDRKTLNIVTDWI
jgi:nitroreductase